MARTGSNFWLGLIIGLLAALLAAALVVLLVPRLRPIIGNVNGPNADNAIALPSLDTSNDPTSVSNVVDNTVSHEGGDGQIDQKVIAQTAENIKVTKPLDGARVSSPMIIEGQARVFESNVSLRVRDGDDKILAETSTMANAPDVGEFGPFSLSLVFSEPKYDSGSLEVFEVSAKNGSEINKVIVPLNF